MDIVTSGRRITAGETLGQLDARWGPLAALIGEWEGESGLDVSYSHSRDDVVVTTYREHASFTPFGPIRNGDQALFGLDYKTAMWRDGEADPFHTEVGYWLWDCLVGEVLRAFVVPRGVTVLAGGRAAPDAIEFSLVARLGGRGYTISENRYLAARASSLSYRVTVTTRADGTWGYRQVTMQQLSELDTLFEHTEKNTLQRIH